MSALYVYHLRPSCMSLNCRDLAAAFLSSQSVRPICVPFVTILYVSQLLRFGRRFNVASKWPSWMCPVSSYLLCRPQIRPISLSAQCGIISAAIIVMYMDMNTKLCKITHLLSFTTYSTENCIKPFKQAVNICWQLIKRGFTNQPQLHNTHTINIFKDLACMAFFFQ